MFVEEERIKQDMMQVGKDLYNKGLLVGTDGNISVRISENELFITASGFCKGRLQPEHITKVDFNGKVLQGLKPARDIRMHLAVYKERPEVKAVVHAHPPITTGFAMSEISFDKVALPEVLFVINSIGVTGYTTPTTIEVPMEVARTLQRDKECQALILANHGALTLGTDVYDAFYKLETLEMFLKATLVSKMVGNTRYLNEDQLQKVDLLKKGADPDEVVPPNRAYGQQPNEEMVRFITSKVQEILKGML
ncbi:MAG: aldolase [Clostridia bacterium]|jgi:L-fuculose-phosphate aldolase|nr:aldolase [Clostridia bacterium]